MRSRGTECGFMQIGDSLQNWIQLQIVRKAFVHLQDLKSKVHVIADVHVAVLAAGLDAM